jgi:nitrogen-specific signal transduction histidine kinase/CheY-like chemotaxis protein
MQPQFEMKMTKEPREQLSERSFEEFYSKAGILYVALNPDLSILGCNCTFEEWLGYSREEIIDRKFTEILPQSAVERGTRCLQICVDRGYIRDEPLLIAGRGGDLFMMQANGIFQAGQGESGVVRLCLKDRTDEDRSGRHLSILSRLFQNCGGMAAADHPDAGLQVIRDLMDAEWVGISGNWNAQPALSGFWRNGDTSLFGLPFLGFEMEKWFSWLQSIRDSELVFTTVSGSSGTVHLKTVLETSIPSDESGLQDFQSLLAVPVQEKTFTGFVILLSRETSLWSVKDLEFLEEALPVFFRSGEPRSGVPAAGSGDEKILMNIPFAGILLLRNGCVAASNEWIRNHLGWPGEELEGKPFFELVVPSHLDSAVALLKRQQDFHPEQLPLVCGDGRIVDCECSPFEWPMNGDSCTVLYVTVREQAQNNIARIVQARKMETLGTLVGGIVHEFNNLLATILGYSTLLGEDTASDNPHYKSIQQITGMAEKATQLTSRLLAFAQGKSHTVPNMAVNSLVNEIAGILSRTLDKKIVIQAELEPKLHPVQGDPNQIQQALFEIALNSRDAMPQGGKLFFQTKNIRINDGDPRLGGNRKPGDYTQISISDTGIGMGLPVKEKIFEPDFSTKEEKPGRGLGLFMVQEVIAAHGGFLSVFSENAKGTVFKIFLPAQAEQARERVRPEPFAVADKKTILLVQNGQPAADQFKQFLTQVGFRVIHSLNGNDAVQVYRKQAKNIDMIILDWMYQGSEGLKVLSGMKRINSRIPILAISDTQVPESTRRQMSEQLSGIIQKPIKSSLLLKKLQSVLQNNA